MTLAAFQLTAHVVDVFNGQIRPARVEVADGKIVAIQSADSPPSTYLLPGFIDAHVHVESSLLVPAEFARVAAVHGTVATVSDPHEIGNVLGVAGVQWMLENADSVPFKFFFGAPSCVPATPHETAGARITLEQVASLLDDERIGYLSEMMDVGGVLRRDGQVMAKIRAALDRGKPVDGHAPGLRGSEAKNYFTAGITTDHECCSKEEAMEKLAYGAKIAIREGSAARNFDALFTLIDEYPDDRIMFCSDDKHPDELLLGHINLLVKRALAGGMDLMNTLRSACVTPVLHYGLDVGLLRPGDDADFIEVDDLQNLRVLRTFIRGELVAEKGVTRLDHRLPGLTNHLHPSTVRAEDLRVHARAGQLNVIEAIDGQLITRKHFVAPKIVDGWAVSDPRRDLLKMVVVNRYETAAPAIAFVKNFGLKRGAIASSVAHDSHNVIAVGVDDHDISTAVNLIMKASGGLSLAHQDLHEILPLPVAGLMSAQPYHEVASAYSSLDQRAKEFGSRLRAPFMTLSFMALLVIPDIKLSDKGLFDAKRLEFMPLFETT